MWLALSWARHMHSDAAWAWFSRQEDNRFFFCRFTQLGLLRLLATSAVMGKDVRTIGQAWKVYDRWLEDSRVGIRQEPFEFDMAFRAATRSVSRLSSPKALDDCYLLAVSQVTDATLVTFDRGLASACRKARQRVALLETRTLAGG
ncbi:MAG: VapC toxin family PIN domain ribonuclease [Bryobacteraceae bacterium]